MRGNVQGGDARFADINDGRCGLMHGCIVENRIWVNKWFYLPTRGRKNLARLAQRRWIIVQHADIYRLGA
jgi:hypothetical protein